MGVDNIYSLEERFIKLFGQMVKLLLYEILLDLNITIIVQIN